MCDMCNGRTRQEVLADIRTTVDEHGWSIQAVSGGGGLMWAYTIGLTERFGHPEMLTIDTDAHRGAHALHHLSERVRDGTPLDRGRSTIEGWTDLEVLDVHPVHTLGDLMTMWHGVHEAQPVDERPPLEVVQVILADVVAEGPRAVRARLDQPHARTPADRAWR